MALSVANYSGHILKLVPGDHQYEFAQFPIVITWNGTDKFGPTQFVRANVVRDWKLGIVQRHISEALKIFEEVEGIFMIAKTLAFLIVFTILGNKLP